MSIVLYPIYYESLKCISLCARSIAHDVTASETNAYGLGFGETDVIYDKLTLQRGCCLDVG